MEGEIKKCARIMKDYGELNIIVMVNRIIIEFNLCYRDKDDFHLIYPDDVEFVKKRVLTSSLKNMLSVCEDQCYVKYVSEKYDDFLTYHAIYQVSSDTRGIVLGKIAQYYRSIDPRNDTIYFKDYDITFSYE